MWVLQLQASSLFFSQNSSRYFLNSVWLLQSSEACAFNGLSLFGSPNNDWIDNRIVRTSYNADHLSFRMSKQIAPDKSMFGWKHGVTNFTIGAAYGYELVNSKCNLYFWPAYAVSSGPLIVPIQRKILSPSGNADMPFSEDIINTISSFCNLDMQNFQMIRRNQTIIRTLAIHTVSIKRSSFIPNGFFGWAKSLNFGNFWQQLAFYVAMCICIVECWRNSQHLSSIQNCEGQTHNDHTQTKNQLVKAHNSQSTGKIPRLCLDVPPQPKPN